MNETELKLLWQSASKKLEASIAISKRNTEDITRLKVQGFLSSMKPIKIFTLIAGILWVIPIGFIIVNLFIHAYHQVSLFFLYSATLQVSLTAVAVAMYIYQLDLIYKIDFGEPVLLIQEKLSRLKLSTLRVARVLFLQLPAWTTFYLSKSVFLNGNIILLIFQCIITCSFLFAAIWLFFNIKFKNRNSKWFRWIFNGKEWQPLLQSMELLSQLERYKDEEFNDEGR